MRKGKRKVEAAAPPPEQARDGAFQMQDIVDRRPGGAFVTVGTAHRRIPMIDRLRAEGLFTTEEHKALAHYRHHANLVDGSLTRDSLAPRSGGGGDGRSIIYLNACALVSQVEAAAGQLAGILRALVVDDVSPSQWAIARHGGIERNRRRKGGPQTCIEPRPKHLAIARMEMKMAAQRVEAELAA